MRFRTALRKAGLAAAAVGLGAGLAAQGVSCASENPADTTEARETRSTLPALPALDLRAPDEYETAAFAFG